MSGSSGVERSVPRHARQFRVQPVRLVGVVADETHRQLIDKPLRECGVHQSDFLRRGAPLDGEAVFECQQVRPSKIKRDFLLRYSGSDIALEFPRNLRGPAINEGVVIVVRAPRTS